MRDWLRFFVYVFYCIEGGLFLAIAPWRSLWEQSYFFVKYSAIREMGLHPIVRGLVSGLGVALVLHGCHELLSAALEQRAVRRAQANDRRRT